MRPLIAELAGIAFVLVSVYLSPPVGIAIVGVALLALGYNLGGRE